MDKQSFFYKLRASKSVRAVVYPIERFNRERLYKQYLKSEDSAFLKTFKDKHKGQRCFVIGNGASLKPEDLDLLVGEITFAANRIYHIFERTKWRPTYYLCMDNDGINTEIDRIKSSGSYLKFINYKAKRFGREAKDHITYVFFKGKFSIDKYAMRIPPLSEDISDHMTQVGTVTVNAIEMAIYMGIETIYLLGVDNNYALKRGADGKVYRDTTVQSSYFEGMKNGQGELGDGLSIQFIEPMNESYRVAKEYAITHGVNIYNATRGGYLEVYDRVDFDTLMGKK